MIKFSKCYETTKVSPFMYEPYNPIKPHLPQKIIYTSSEKQPPEVFYKKMLLKMWEISHKNTCVRVSF